MKYVFDTSILCAFLVCGVLFATGCSKKTAPVPGKLSVVPAVPGQVTVLDDANFDAQIVEGVILVDFWAGWCRPCKIQGPIVAQVAEAVKDSARVGKLDVDASPRTTKKFGLNSIPTLIVFKDGKPARQFVGVTTSNQLIEAINEQVPRAK